MRWLVLRICGPLAAFGGVAVDARGVTRDFPAASALTGLFANALGYERRDVAALQALQDRIVFAARREAEPPLGRMQDFQTVQLAANDRAWTTRGHVEGRRGGAGTYKSPHIRWRDYHADARLTAALRLTGQDAPTLDDLAAALDRPARPLFLGRKSCLPAAPLFGGFVEAPNAPAALEAIEGETSAPLRAQWPAEEHDGRAGRAFDLTDQRNWRSGLHGGGRRVYEGRIRAKAPPA